MLLLHCPLTCHELWLNRGNSTWHQRLFSGQVAGLKMRSIKPLRFCALFCTPRAFVSQHLVFPSLATFFKQPATFSFLKPEITDGHGSQHSGGVSAEGGREGMTGAFNADAAEIDCQDIEGGLGGALHGGDQKG